MGKPAQSGKWFNALHYEVDKETGLIDYNAMKNCYEKNLKLAIAGGSAYSRIIDFKKFRDMR